MNTAKSTWLGLACILCLTGLSSGQMVPLDRTQPAIEKEKPLPPSAVKVARLHYSGGGDWYWGSSAIPNLLCYVRDNTDILVDTTEKQLTIMDPDLFEYPFLFATGHGVIKFSAEEKERLRRYLNGGGFLFVNDSYGMDRSFRREMATIFPEREVIELPFEHPLSVSYTHLTLPTN